MTYDAQHSTGNSLLNFCENRVLFINEGGKYDSNEGMKFFEEDSQFQAFIEEHSKYFSNMSEKKIKNIYEALKKKKNSFLGLIEGDLKTFYDKKSPKVSLIQKSNKKLEIGKIAENLQAIRTFIDEYYLDIVRKYPFAWTEIIPTNAIDLDLTKTSICSSISELIRGYLKKINIDSILIVRQNSIHHSIIVRLGNLEGKNMVILIDVNTGGESSYSKNGVRVWNWRDKPDISDPFLIKNIDNLLNVKIVSPESHEEVIDGVQSFYSIQYEDSELFFKALSEYNKAKNFQKSENLKEQKKSLFRCINYLEQVLVRLPIDHPLALDAKSRINKIQEKLEDI